MNLSSCITSFIRNGLLYILVVIFLCCEEPPDFGPSASEIDPPQTNGLSATVSPNSSANIAWEANESSRIFDFRLEYVTGTSDIYHSWVEMDTTSSTSVTFENLDEGEYKFYIQGRYDLDNVGVEDTLLFLVNAITGPALRIYPLNQIANPGDEIDVYLYFEEVPQNKSVAGFHIDIQIASNYINFIENLCTEGAENIECEGSLVSDFKALGGTAIFMPPDYNADNTTKLIYGFADAPGSSAPGLHGTGSLLRFSLKVSEQAINGTYGISIMPDNVELEDLLGPIGGFQSPRSGSVTIEGAIP